MTEWMKARKKPIVIRYREINPTWHTISGSPRETIHTREGSFEATEDDYIIEGVWGELYPIKKAIFNETHEELP